MVGVFLPPPRSPGGQRPAWSKLVPAPLSPSWGPRSTAGQHPRPTLSKPILSQSSGGCHGNRCSQSHTSSARTSDRGCVGPGTGISAASCHRESLHWGLKTQPTKDTANPESHWLAPPPPVLCVCSGEGPFSPLTMVWVYSWSLGSSYGRFAFFSRSDRNP